MDWMEKKLGRKMALLVMQTETPEQLKAFNDSAPKGGKRKVVRREAIVTLSPGTLMDAGMVAACPHDTFVATISELPEENADSGYAQIGVCAVEASQGRVLLGQFKDGPLRSNLQRCFMGALSVFVPTTAKHGPCYGMHRTCLHGGGWPKFA
jgi:DNA mismatch repair ATPase MutS